MPRPRAPDVVPLHLALDRTSRAAMHRQLYEALRTAILGGVFRPGERLPSTRALASDLGVSRTTVLQAFDRLVSEGYAAARAGGGTRVAAHVAAHVGRAPGRHRAGDATRARPPAAPPFGVAPGGAGGNGWPDGPALATTPHLSRAGAAYTAEVRWARLPVEPVPFAASLPAVGDFPVATWSRLLTRRWRHDAATMLTSTEPCGYAPLREAIARYVRAARGVRCTAEQVVVVNGAMHGVDLAARLLLDAGDAAWVEEPSFLPARAALAAAGARLVDVPVDAHGLDVAEGIRRAPGARLAFVTPSFQSPLGVTLSLERRLALLEWAAGAGAWVLEDDYNGEYRYDTHPIPALQGLDDHGRVVYVGSFSKTLSPALRVGYLVVPPCLVEPITRARIASDRHTPVGEQVVLADFIAGGHFARHIRRTRDLYRARQRALLDLAATQAGGLLEMQAEAAGMWAVGFLPADLDDRDVTREALARGVVAAPLSAFASRAASGRRPGLVLGFAAYEPDAMRPAFRTLIDVIRRLRPGRLPPRPAVRGRTSARA